FTSHRYTLFQHRFHATMPVSMGLTVTRRTGPERGPGRVGTRPGRTESAISGRTGRPRGGEWTCHAVPLRRRRTRPGFLPPYRDPAGPGTAESSRAGQDLRASGSVGPDPGQLLEERPGDPRRGHDGALRRILDQVRGPVPLLEQPGLGPLQATRRAV